ncbi:MAG: DUF167 domain-containing protein [Deltaproteobacteria bacterium]|nr:DUF167 domain-containing protein [Deltaproteobacteria bacterium]
MPPQLSGKAPGYLKETSRGVVISIIVQPRSSRDEVFGEHGDMLKIRLKAPPVYGEANSALISFLSKLLKIPKSSIEITSGETSKRKTVLLCGVSIDGAAERLLKTT